MAGSLQELLSASEQDRRDVFAATASRLDTLPGYVEKDLWVCFVLEVLFNRLPEGYPNLRVKGGTSLSKAFGLIDRFSEDIDIVVSRDGLGFSGDRDPAMANALSNKKRAALFEELRNACSAYIGGKLQPALASRLDEVAVGCRVLPDEGDTDRQTLFVDKSAVVPYLTCAVVPFIADEWCAGYSTAPPRVPSGSASPVHGPDQVRSHPTTSTARGTFRRRASSGGDVRVPPAQAVQGVIPAGRQVWRRALPSAPSIW